MVGMASSEGAAEKQKARRRKEEGQNTSTPPFSSYSALATRTDACENF